MKTVLFVCIHNAGRSQMAEALFNRVVRGKALGVSAGTRPTDHVHPEVVEVMREIGIDLAGKKPQSLTLEMMDTADRVITMGCMGDASCPAALVPSEDWALEDPAG